MASSILIAICTRNRPDLLRRLLLSLGRCDDAGDVAFSVLVVENNATETCREIVAAAASGFNARYVLEPEVGLVPARNRALDEAAGTQADWVAFVDDDETVDVGWMAAMARALATWKDERGVLTGPCMKLRPADAEVFLPLQIEDKSYGQMLPTALTNNTLIPRRVFDRAALGIRFDPDLTVSGGEDIEFFYRVRDAGVPIRWVSDAFVFETQFPPRATLGYHFARVRGFQTTNLVIRRKRMGPARAAATDLQRFLRSAALAGVYVLWGAPLMLFDHVMGRQLLGRAAIETARLAGIVDYYLGRRSRAYAPDGGR